MTGPIGYRVYICCDCGGTFPWKPWETAGHMKPNGREQCLGHIWELVQMVPPSPNQSAQALIL